MPKRDEFPNKVPEHQMVHLTVQEQWAVIRFVELNWSQTKISKHKSSSGEKVSLPRVNQLLSTALAKINGTYIPVSKQLDIDDVSNLPPESFAATM